MFGFAVSVDTKHFERVMKSDTTAVGAYTFCLGVCISSVNHWAEKSGYEGKFSYFFEAGHKDAAEANRIMNALPKTKSYKAARYLSHTFLGKEDAPPLQAADMLAWFAANHVKRQLRGVEGKRADFEALLRPKDELLWINQGLVDQWGKLNEQLNDEVLEKFAAAFPDQSAIAYAKSLMGRS